MVQANDIYKAFGSTHALNGVDLFIERGQVLALLGPNGAGKTTLVRILATLLRPDRGAASVAGFDAVHEAASLRRSIGLSGQFVAIDKLLTGRENLELIGGLHHLGRAEARRRAAEALERLSLDDVADRQAKTYSGGMRRRLDLALSLLARPSVLMLDEPTAGLDPRSRAEVWALIEELVAEGTTLLLTTQYLEEADRIGNRVAVVEHGRVIVEGTAAELKNLVGGDTIEMHIAPAADFECAVAALASLRNGAGSVDLEHRRLRLPATDGTMTLTSVLRQLEQAAVAVDDIGLRRPSLDDVFLALTGRSAGPNSEVRG